jgi:hypothetical protein
MKRRLYEVLTKRDGVVRRDSTVAKLAEARARAKSLLGQGIAEVQVTRVTYESVPLKRGGK